MPQSESNNARPDPSDAARNEALEASAATNATDGVPSPADTRSPAAGSRRGLRRLLFALLAVGAGLGGFYVSYRVYQPRVGSTSDLSREQLDRVRQLRDSLAKSPPAEAPATAAPAASLPVPDSEQPPETTEALLEEAQRIARALVERFPTDPDAHEMQGRLRLWAGSTAQAEAAWRQCLELNPDYVYAYRGLAGIQAKRGDYDEAVTLLRQALLRQPNSSEIQTELAKTLINQGTLDEAITLLEVVTRNDPKAVEAFVQLGMAHLQRQELEQAKENYTRAVALSPGHASAHLGLANVCARLGQTDEAREHRAQFSRIHDEQNTFRRTERNQYDDVDAMREDVARTYTNMGRVCLSHQDVQAAERLWKRAALLHPEDLNCRQALAWHYLKRGKWERTIEMLRALAHRDPDNPTYLLEIARIYAQTNQLPDAERALKELCQTLPNDAAGYAALAELYLRTNRQADQAVSLSQKAVELAPDAENYVRLSAAHERSHDLPAALAAMEQAMTRAPDNLQYRQLYELMKKEAGEKGAPAEDVVNAPEKD